MMVFCAFSADELEFERIQESFQGKDRSITYQDFKYLTEDDIKEMNLDRCDRAKALRLLNKLGEFVLYIVCFVDIVFFPAQQTPQKGAKPSTVQIVGSEGSGSAVKVSTNDLHEQVKQTIMDVTINRNGHRTQTFVNSTSCGCSAELVLEELLTAQCVSIQVAKEHLLLNPKLQLTETEKQMYGLRFQPSQMHVRTETEFQGLFEKANEDNKYALMTATANKRTPFAKAHGASGTFNFTGKVDVCHVLRPLGVEFKGGKGPVNRFEAPKEEDIKVIVQCIERVCTLGCTQTNLRSVVFFGVTSTCLWIVTLRRNWVDSTATETLTILRADPYHLCLLWALLTKEVVLDRSIIFDDVVSGYHLSKFLNGHLKLAGLCRVVCIGRSTSKVWGVSFPTVKGSTVVVSQRTEEKDLAIKVIATDAKFEQEVRCLEAYAATHPESLLQFYAIGHCRGDLMKFFTSDWKHHLNQFSENLAESLAPQCGRTDPLPWWEYIPAPCQGGIILMRCADYAGLHRDAYADVSNRVVGVQESLRKFHEAGVLHCDLRPQNMMYFPQKQLCGAAGNEIVLPNGWQLVDLSLGGLGSFDARTNLCTAVAAISIASSPPVKKFHVRITIYKMSGQYMDAGISVVKAGKCTDKSEFEYTWTLDDDHEMLMATILKLAIK